MVRRGQWISTQRSNVLASSELGCQSRHLRGAGACPSTSLAEQEGQAIAVTPRGIRRIVRLNKLRPKQGSLAEAGDTEAQFAYHAGIWIHRFSQVVLRSHLE